MFYPLWRLFSLLLAYNLTLEGLKKLGIINEKSK